MVLFLTSEIIPTSYSFLILFPHSSTILDKMLHENENLLFITLTTSLVWVH